MERLEMLHKRFSLMAQTRIDAAEIYQKKGKIGHAVDMRQLAAAYQRCADELGLVIAGQAPPEPGTMWAQTDEVVEIIESEYSKKTQIEQTPISDPIIHAPLAKSIEADFEALTWTFQIAPDCRVGAGTYALVWINPASSLAPPHPPGNTPASAGSGPYAR